jgi:hypothetical protein
MSKDSASSIEEGREMYGGVVAVMEEHENDSSL